MKAILLCFAYLLSLVLSFTSTDQTRKGRGATSLWGVSGDDDTHPLAETSFLSHIMLKVPSVDETVDYWVRKGGKIRLSKSKDESMDSMPNGESQATTGLKSAFVELGSTAKQEENEAPICFALEIVETSKNDYTLGNSLSYIGVSMLLQFQNNLLGAITGEETPQPQGDEPNGISVQSAASAPGDFLARIALRSQNLEATHRFYTSVLGMEAKAEDEKMLCLRYDNDCFSGGVPTTLVFDYTSDNIEKGDCFDHFVVATSANLDDLHSQCAAEASKDETANFHVFMKPTDMFGKRVMGLIDPNGYKVVLASS